MEESFNRDKISQYEMVLAMVRVSMDDHQKGLFLGPNENSPQYLENRESLAQGYYRLAKVYYDKSDLHQAEIYFLESWKLVNDSKDVFFIFKILGFLVRIASEKLDTSNAEKYILESERLVEEISSTRVPLTSEYFYNKGIIRTYRGKFQSAREGFLSAFQKSKEENEPEIQAKSLYALAIGHFHLKEYSKALSSLEQLSELLNILNKSYLLGTMNFLYGNIYSEIGEFPSAIKYYKMADIALLSKTCWNLFSYIKLGEGIVYKKLGEFNKALLYFELGLNSIDSSVFKRLHGLISSEILDVNDSNVDLFLDRNNRIVYEKVLGAIDFKHRFILLEILFLLAQNPGVHFDKEELARSVWRDEYNPLIHDKLIYTSVSRLRKLIEPAEERGKYIIRGKDGYTFNKNIKTRFKRENGLDVTPSIGNVELSSPV